ncbi:hypothetical protein [Streptomyces sp. SID13031]|uniref:hypothetical protein n=1 Tax=Streptomyces sp. SID13031 TaxID=2706046 RepID=UPI0013C6755F|nr:hypothetical protein [Streptomyces sp. SID13031]NEA36879.1 hypothetical protein [Streptomyces sp. SID13031]
MVGMLALSAMIAPRAFASTVPCNLSVSGDLTPRVRGGEYHATFGDPVTLSWHVATTCGARTEIYINTTYAAQTISNVSDGSILVSPAATTSYRLNVRTYRQDGSSFWAFVDTETVMVGRVAEYRRNSEGRVVEYRLHTSAVRTAAGRDAARVLSNVKEGYRQYAAGKLFRVDLIPHGLKLTDLPGYTYLRGVHTIDGRLYDDVRGIANVHELPNVAVGEEDILDDSMPTRDGRFDGNTLIHELGHIVLIHSTPGNIRTTAESMRQAQVERGGDFVGDDSYTSFNVDEYFAEATPAWFMRPLDEDTQHEYSRPWLQDNDRPLYELMREVYTS